MIESQSVTDTHRHMDAYAIVEDIASYAQLTLCKKRNYGLYGLTTYVHCDLQSFCYY